MAHESRAFLVSIRVYVTTLPAIVLSFWVFGEHLLEKGCLKKVLIEQTSLNKPFFKLAPVLQPSNHHLSRRSAQHNLTSEDMEDTSVQDITGVYSLCSIVLSMSNQCVNRRDCCWDEDRASSNHAQP